MKDFCTFGCHKQLLMFNFLNIELLYLIVFILSLGRLEVVLLGLFYFLFGWQLSLCLFWADDISNEIFIEA